MRSDLAGLFGYVVGFLLGAMTVLLATRKQRRLGKDIGQAELLHVTYYDAPKNRVYLGGKEPQVIGPGRVEVLYFPGDEASEADSQ